MMLEPHLITGGSLILLSMCRRFSLASVMLLLAQVTFTGAHQCALLFAQSFPVGSPIERVSCSDHPEQSYALYLPSNYSSARSWPVLYSFDPAARGIIPIELEKEAAERFGYILAASNNSRNGPWKAEAEAADAMLNDTQAKFSIDTRRIYFAGFSGGARLAAQLATLCKCAAGILLSGAGFPSGREPTKDVSFAVFSAVGTMDFNYREVIPLQAKLALAETPHWLRSFDGTHEWAPSQVISEALAWFRVQSIKSKLASPDDSFLRDQFTESVARADSFAQSQDTLNAFREYSQIVRTYNGLLDVAALRAKVDALDKAKSLRDATRQESREFEEQDQLTAGISAALFAPAALATDPPAGGTSAVEQIRLLRERTEQEKQPRRAVVFRRALAGVFVEAMEFGNEAQDHRDYQRALRAYKSATEANLHSEWAWQSLAVVEANLGSRKGVFVALGHARNLATDRSRFRDWLNHEPAFTHYQSSSEFQDLQKPD